MPGCGPTASACEPHRDFIELSASKGRNAKAIYQDLVDDYGIAGRYQSVKRFVRRRARSSSRRRGEEAQVDYGTGPMVLDRATGRHRRTRLFVLTLGDSRKAVRLLTFQSNARTWAELHERAFRRLGGATRTVVLENLGEGVLKPDIYDPALNPLYRDVLSHDGAVALPCRVGDPDRTAEVVSLADHLDLGNEDLAKLVLQVALDLADSRRGGLFAILDDAASVHSLISPADLLGHGEPEAPGVQGADSKGSLYLLNGKRTADLRTDVLRTLATIDGGIVLDTEGRLFAFGAILRHRHENEAVPDRVAQGGGRSVAALAASHHGTALKISEDGTISFFEQGKWVWDL